MLVGGAADHAAGQPRLKRLVDDAAAPGKIGLAARHEFLKRQVLWDAPPLGLQDAHGVRCTGARSGLLDLPNPQAVSRPRRQPPFGPWTLQAARVPMVRIHPPPGESHANHRFLSGGERQVRVVAPFIGGGFGPKIMMFYPEEVLLPWLAIR